MNKKISLFVAILLPLFLIACDNGSSSDDDNFQQGGQSVALCFEVTFENIQGNALPKGPDALGGIGDFVLSNGIVHFVVDGGILGSRGQHHLSPTGGTLIDATFAREDRDQLNQLSQILNFDNNLPVVALGFRIVESSGTRAVLEVTGGVLDPLGSLGLGLTRDPASGLVIGIEVITTYSLDIGDRYLQIDTDLNNLTGQILPVFTIANLGFTGTRSMKPFFPAPTRGLFQPPFTLPAGPSDFVFVPAAGLSGSHERGAEINYSIASATSGILLAVSDGSEPNEARFFAVGNPGSPTDVIPPAATLNFTREFFVATPDLGGMDNGCAASLGAAYEHLADVSTNPLNIIQRTGQIQGIVSPVIKGADILFVQTSPALFFDGAGFSDFSTLGGVPMSHAVSQTNGFFRANLPPGVYSLFIDAPGRPQSVITDLEVFSDRIISLGAVDLLGEDPTSVAFQVTDSATGNPIPAKVTVKGTGGTLDPDFGRFNLAAGDRNIVYTRSGGGSMPLTSGTYDVFFSRGPEWDVLVASITVPGTGSVTAALTHEVDSSGFIGADFHVHSEGSFDSSVPIPDRVDSIVGEGLEIVVASEHDKVSNYSNQIFLSQLDGYTRSYGGLESTTNIPAIPTSFGFPATIGHWISFPQRVRPEAGGNGAQQDEFIQPGLLMDLLVSNTEFVGNIFVDPVPGTIRGFNGVPVILAHPNTTPVSGLGIGYFANFGYTDLLPLSDPANAFLTSPILSPTTGAPLTATRNLDFNCMEILSNVSQIEYAASRTDWFSFLDQGEFKTAIGSSDSHTLTDPVGFPRTYFRVASDNTLTMSDGDFLGSVLDGNGFLTNGPFVRVDIAGVGPGELLDGPNATVTLNIDVQAANWVNTTAINIYRNGDLISSFPTTSTSVSRFSGTATVDVDPAAGDSYFVVEVVGDISTTYSIIAPDHTPTALSNPIFVDEDGNGTWEPPGL